MMDGSSKAFEQLFRSCYDVLFSYGLRLSRDEELISDSIQDIFIYIWVHRLTLSPANSVKAYLLSTLRRDILRKLKRNNVTFSFEAVGNAQEIAEPVADEQILKRQLWELVDRLPSRQRESIYLRFDQQLSYAQIALVMGLSYQGARNLVYKACSKLRLVSETRQFKNGSFDDVVFS